MSAFAPPLVRPEEPAAKDDVSLGTAGQTLPPPPDPPRYDPLQHAPVPPPRLTEHTDDLFEPYVDRPPGPMEMLSDTVKSFFDGMGSRAGLQLDDKGIGFPGKRNRLRFDPLVEGVTYDPEPEGGRSHTEVEEVPGRELEPIERTGDD
jgi:hypothetical protein